jgi:hypothetical protein
MEEPSVLDYIKSRLAFWRKDKITLPAESRPQASEASPRQDASNLSEAVAFPVESGMAEGEVSPSALCMTPRRRLSNRQAC